MARRLVAALGGIIVLAVSSNPALARDADRDAVGATAPGFSGLSVMPGMPGYVETDLSRLHYWQLGEGQPILLLHQAPWFSIEFSAVMPLLAERGYRAVAVDIPGFGLSSRPDRPATADDYAASLAALLDHLGIERTAVAGSLTGATIALAMATRRPDRVSCLTLQSLPVYTAEEVNSRVKAPPPDTTLFADGRHIEAWWQSMTGRSDRLADSPATVQWLMIGSLLSGDFSWYGDTTGETFITRAFDAGAALPDVRAPTLVLSLGDGSLSDAAKRTRAIRPDFTFATAAVPSGILALDHPEEWVGHVTAFHDRACGSD